MKSPLPFSSYAHDKPAAIGVDHLGDPAMPRPAAPRGVAQAFAWKSDATFYGDNTEFFNPYRVGETILGAQMQTYFSVAPGPRTEVILGVYGDHRSGRSDFFDEVKPLLGFRYHTQTSLGVLGTLVTDNRHGYLEPLEVTTLEFTRPVEKSECGTGSQERFQLVKEVAPATPVIPVYTPVGAVRGPGATET